MDQANGTAPVMNGEAQQVFPLAQAITVQTDQKLVDMTPTKFNFRKVEIIDPVTKKQAKDDKGQLAFFKRPTLELSIPLLTMAGLEAALKSGESVQKLVLEQANAVIYDVARLKIQEKIEENDDVVLTPEMIDVSKLGYVEIANMPRAARTPAISKEEMEEFVADYLAVMQTEVAIEMMPPMKNGHKKRELDTLETHGQLFANKFNRIKSRKDVVTQMLQFLDVWLANSTKAEEFGSIYKILKDKGDQILKGADYDNL